MQTIQSSKLSNLQLELLKLFSTNVPEQDLKNIKNYLSNYFAQKAIKEADKIWDEKSFSNELMDKWLNE
jgi:hypothetical protein